MSRAFSPSTATPSTMYSCLTAYQQCITTVSTGIVLIKYVLIDQKDLKATRHHSSGTLCLKKSCVREGRVYETIHKKSSSLCGCKIGDNPFCKMK